MRFYIQFVSQEIMQQDIEKAKEKLKKEPFTYLQDPKGLVLRDYPVKKVEKALDKGQKKSA